MARRNRDATGDGEVEIFASGSGLVVSGSTTDVASFIDQMMTTTRKSGGRARHMVVDSFQVGANVLAYRQTHREYIEFSARAMKLLKEHGAIATEDGNYRSFVRQVGKFAGNLDWKKVDLGPEQALSMQAAAGQLALKAAIKEVTAAIERVEGKVDQLVRLANAERLGAVLGDRATLHPLVDRFRSTGVLSATDWSTVDHLGALIARDIESLRAYILKQLGEVESSSLVRSRADEAEDLTEVLLLESIALLVVAEQNYTLWQELRLANGLTREKDAVAGLTSDVHAQLAALAKADQQVVDRLGEVMQQLTVPTGFEGFAPLKKKQLTEHVSDLGRTMAWFADQRHLDVSPVQVEEFATLTQSLSKTAGVAAAVARRTGKALVVAATRRDDEVEPSRPPELMP